MDHPAVRKLVRKIALAEKRGDTDAADRRRSKLQTLIASLEASTKKPTAEPQPKVCKPERFKCPGCKKTFSSEKVMRQHAQAKNHRAPQPSKKRKQAAAAAQQEEDVEDDCGIIHPFDVDPDDHCETPPEAYEHIAPILNTLAKGLGKDTSELEIYDPYFCAGGVVQRLGDLGFTNVYNKCEDCYAMWKKPDALPDFDCILTNPPYSEDHMQRIVRYCAQSGKPWFLLMPNYVADKPYYSSILQPTGLKPFYLCPQKRYTYLPPKGLRSKKASSTQKKTSPFVSFWYCCGVDTGTSEALARTVRPTKECRLAKSLEGLAQLGVRDGANTGSGGGGGGRGKKRSGRQGGKKRRIKK